MPFENTALELSDSKINRFQEAFNAIDKNGTGVISFENLNTFVKSAIDESFPEKYINELISEVDKNNDGKIEFAEFLTIMLMMETVQDEEDQELVEAFRVFDVNHEGTLWRDELESVLTSIGDKLDKTEIDQLVLLADIDDDGHIDYQEFVKMIFCKK